MFLSIHSTMFLTAYIWYGRIINSFCSLATSTMYLLIIWPSVHLARKASAKASMPLILRLSGAAYSYTGRSEEHTSELQSLMRTSSAVFCLKKKKQNQYQIPIKQHNQ